MSQPPYDQTKPLSLKFTATRPSPHLNPRITHPTTNPMHPKHALNASVTASLQNLLCTISRNNHPPKHAGVVLSYTTFIFLIITQLVLTNYALVRLHRNTFPPQALHLQQLHEQQALPLQEAAYWSTQLQPLNPDQPFHDQFIQDETFSGRYQACLIPSAIIRSVHLSANDPATSPNTYRNLIVQTESHTWTLRHHEN